MKKIFCLLSAMIICCNAFSGIVDSAYVAKDTVVIAVYPKVYHVSIPLTSSIIGVGMISDFFAIKRLKSKNEITNEELLFANSSQQKNLISSIDQWSLHQKASDRDLYKKTHVLR